MADVQAVNGVPVRGTPLWRLAREVEAAPEAEVFKWHAGEVRDVAKALDPKEKAAAAALAATDGKEPWEVLKLKAAEAKGLVAAALTK